MRLLILAIALGGAICTAIPARAQVDADFSAGGAIRVGTSTTTCNSSAWGAVRYNSTTNLLQFCNNSAWTNFTVGVNTIDGLTDGKTDYTTDHNFAMGSNAGNALASGGQYNFFLGEGAGQATTTGDFNTAVGYQALNANVTNSGNTAFGYQALTILNGGSNNTALGSSALASATTSNNNTAVGFQALTANVSGDNNTALGYAALATTTGSNNTAVGAQALYTNGAGSNGTAAGYKALYLATGSNNIALGYQAGDNISSGANNIIIGYDVDAPSATASNQLNIGNIIFASGIDGTGTTISSGNVGIGLNNPASAFVVKSDVTEDIPAGGTIPADECGSIKKIKASTAVTTNTTNTFTAPTSGYDGCCMEVFNTGANNITLDQNAKFKTVGAANVVLTSGDFVRVCSNGTNWYQVAPMFSPN